MGRLVRNRPKGGAADTRTIPMTSTVERALKRLEVVRDGFVVRNLDGSPKRDGQMCHAIERARADGGAQSVTAAC
jgi:hypothetical protein